MTCYSTSNLRIAGESNNCKRKWLFNCIQKSGVSLSWLHGLQTFDKRGREKAELEGSKCWSLCIQEKKKRFSRGNKEVFIELFVRVGVKTSHLHPELIFPRTEATKAKLSELSSVVRTPETAARLALLDFYIHKTCICIHNPPATSC